MIPEAKEPKDPQKGIWRFPPARLLRWVDRQGSPTLIGIVSGVIATAVIALAGLFGKKVASLIPSLKPFVSALQTQFLLELWMLLLCIAVPLLGVLCLIWVRIRRPIIHSAKYGANANFDDVKWKVEKEVRRGKRTIPAENSFFGEGNPGYDPCRNVLKSLTIDYSIRGRRTIPPKTVEEHKHIILD